MARCVGEGVEAIYACLQARFDEDVVQTIIRRLLERMQPDHPLGPPRDPMGWALKAAAVETVAMKRAEARHARKFVPIEEPDIVPRNGGYQRHWDKSAYRVDTHKAIPADTVTPEDRVAAAELLVRADPRLVTEAETDAPQMSRKARWRARQRLRKEVA